MEYCSPAITHPPKELSSLGKPSTGLGKSGKFLVADGLNLLRPAVSIELTATLGRRLSGGLRPEKSIPVALPLLEPDRS